MLCTRLIVGIVLLTGCVPTSRPHYAHATGAISGKVVDAAGRPVAGAEVWAISYSPWMPIGSTLPFAIVDAQTTTAADGTFTVAARGTIKELSAHTNGLAMSGDVKGVRQTGNVIRVARPRPLP
jgi:hypothetical protein